MHEDRDCGRRSGCGRREFEEVEHWVVECVDEDEGSVCVCVERRGAEIESVEVELVDVEYSEGFYHAEGIFGV